MQAANRNAFKEWGVICAALGAGRQSVIFRKGGIHEGRAGFRVAHSEFWLFPTRFHEGADALIAEAAPLLERVKSEAPANGLIALQQYAVVTDVLEVQEESLLMQTAGLHLWSPQTLHARFHYRQPGLFALVVRMYQSAAPIVIPDSPHFTGCRSWVDLPDDLPTAGLQPVLSDAEFGEQRARLLSSLTPRATV